MNKMLLGTLAVTALAISLYAGHLTGESTSGMYKTCYYSDGQVLSIPYTSYCPKFN